MAELDDIKKQISDLNKRIGELGGAFKTNIDSYISSFGNDITAANKALTEMQKIFSNFEFRFNLGKNAREYMLEHHSFSVMGAAIKNRLEEIKVLTLQ